MTKIWNKNMFRSVIIVALIVMIPLVLQLMIDFGVDGQGFNWELSDFVIISTLLFGIGLAIDFAIRKFTNPKHRIVIIITIIFIFLLVWAELAVGLFGAPFAGS